MQCAKDIKENYLYNLHKFLSKNSSNDVLEKKPNKPVKLESYLMKIVNSKNSTHESKYVFEPNIHESLRDWLFTIPFTIEKNQFKIEVHSERFFSSSILMSIKKEKKPSILKFIPINASNIAVSFEEYSVRSIINQFEYNRNQYRKFCNPHIYFALDHMVLLYHNFTFLSF